MPASLIATNAVGTFTQPSTSGGGASPFKGSRRPHTLNTRQSAEDAPSQAECGAVPEETIGKAPEVVGWF